MANKVCSEHGRRNCTKCESNPVVANTEIIYKRLEAAAKTILTELSKLRSK